jgi:hypothetical protein
MKKNIKLLLVLLFIPFILNAQDEDKKEDEKAEEKLERSAFESATLIDNPTNVLFNKNTLEVIMSHRFGLLDGGENDLVGIWAPSNIRIGVSYAVHDRITVGFGTTKFDRLQDFNWKLALLRQTRSNKMPVSVSYYGNFTVDARKKENFNLTQDRYSFFNQIIIAKRFSQNFSFQVAPSVSHYNLVDKTMKNDMFAIAFGGRYKISPQTGILVDYSQPITTYSVDTPKPGLSVAVEFSTSAHTFQLIVSNYNGIVPQKNYMFNQHDFFDGDILIGFNITRNYNF